MNNSKLRLGFTLIEILVAIFLVSFGLIAAIGVFSACVGYSSTSEEMIITSTMERDALGQIELLHRMPSGHIGLTYDDSENARENYFYYPHPAGGAVPGFYCCYTVLPLENDTNHPEITAEVSGRTLVSGAATVMMRFVREPDSIFVEQGEVWVQTWLLDPRNKPEWPNEENPAGAIPSGEMTGKIRVFKMFAGKR